MGKQDQARSPKSENLEREPMHKGEEARGGESSHRDCCQTIAELEKHRRGLEVLTGLSRKVGTAQEAGEVSRILVSTIVCELNFDRALILAPSEVSDELIPETWLGFSEDEVSLLTPRVPDFFCKYRDNWQKGLVLNGSSLASPIYEDLRLTFDIPFLILAPVISGREVLAIIVAGDLSKDKPGKQPLDELDLQIFMSISAMVAVALRNIHFKSVLLDSESKYRSLVESVQELVWEIDPCGRFTFVSSQVREILGRERYEITGRQVCEITPMREELHGYFKKVMEKKEPIVGFEHPFAHRNGDIIWLEVNGVPVLDNSGNLVAYRGTCRDITERKRGEEALRLQYYTRTLIETSPDPIFVIATDGFVIDVNQAAAKVINKNRAKLLGLRFSNFFQDKIRAEDFIASIFKEGHIRDCELSMQSSAGEVVIFLYNASVFKSQDGRIAGAVAVARDITRLKKAREEIEREKNYSSFLIDQAHDGLVVWEVNSRDFKTRSTVWNRWMRENTGYTIEEINEQGLFTSLFKERKMRTKVSRQLQKMVRERSFTSIESQVSTKDGRTQTFSFSFSIMLESADLLHILSIVRDVTREKELRDQLLQTEKLSSVGKMVSGIAHEINNPLTGIIGFSQMMLFRHDLDPELRESAQLIHDESERARKIVRDLLTFARRHKAEKAPCLINDILRDVMKIRKVELDQNHIHLEMALEEKQPVLVFGDHHQLQQVFLNVINNAIDAIPEQGEPGRLCVKTRISGNRAIVSIQDNGGGIEERERSKIFDPFYTSKQVGRGTGLGLSISYGIIEEHGGKIYFESVPGKGTIFHIELLLMKKKPVTKKTSRNLSEGFKMEKLAGKRILVIDDEPVILNLFEQFLRPRGIVVDTVSDGNSGLKRIKEGEYDLVFMDFILPEIDGRSIYEEISRSSPHYLRRIVFMTGDIRDSTRLFFEERSIEPLCKPFDIIKVKEILGNFFGQGPLPGIKRKRSSDSLR